MMIRISFLEAVDRSCTECPIRFRCVKKIVLTLSVVVVVVVVALQLWPMKKEQTPGFSMM